MVVCWVSFPSIHPSITVTTYTLRSGVALESIRTNTAWGANQNQLPNWVFGIGTKPFTKRTIWKLSSWISSARVTSKVAACSFNQMRWSHSKHPTSNDCSNNTSSQCSSMFHSTKIWSFICCMHAWVNLEVPMKVICMWEQALGI